MRRIIAVVDLFSPGSKTGRVAIATAGKHLAELHFVALFDHLDDVTLGGASKLSPQERFRHTEMELLKRLRQHTASMGVHDATCTVLTGHPGEELSRMAQQWRADLIMADRVTARTIHNSWIPWFHTVTSLPCRLQVIAEERKNLWMYVAHWLH